ncbi:MFS transporter [Aquamicrobium sp. LC103]|uniref:MFS transporter n=1 Tax=Aquamicrobium sp. LC103 TaxID=1120658 RepID=UPI00069B8358|nr:MFS transporter [Aquamicrobium sp. LC103]TKT77593.1 MFS transporter [Aquamicrobium sp. LC103]
MTDASRGEVRDDLAAARAAPAERGGPGRAAEATLVLTGSLVVFATAVVAPALPAIQAYFSDDPRAEHLVRLVVTMPALVIALVAPFAGYFLDRFARKPIVFAALVGFVLFGSLGLAANSLDMLLLTRAGLGLSVAFLMAGFTSLVGDYFEPKKRAALMGRQVSANSVVALSMMIAGGLLAEMSWRGTFLIYLIAAPLIPMLWLFLPRAPRTANVRTSTGDDGSEAPAWDTVLAVYALAVLCPLIQLVMHTQSPFFIAQAHHGTPTMIAVALSASIVGVFPASMLYGRLRARFSAWAVFAAGFAIMAGGYFLQGMAPSFMLLAGAMVLSGMGFGLIMPNLSATLLSAAPPRLRGRLSGGLVSCIFLGQFLSPVVSQPVIARYGYETTFILTAALAGFVAAVLVIRASAPRPVPAE